MADRRDRGVWVHDPTLEDEAGWLPCRGGDDKSSMRTNLMGFRSIASRMLGPSLTWQLSVIEQTIHGLRHLARPMPRACNTCGFQGYFRAVGWPIRPEAQCPRCGSVERHRLFGLWLDANASLVQGKRVMHFAPEPVISALISCLASEYVTADLLQASAILSLTSRI